MGCVGRAAAGYATSWAASRAASRLHLRGSPGVRARLAALPERCLLLTARALPLLLPPPVQALTEHHLSASASLARAFWRISTALGVYM